MNTQLAFFFDQTRCMSCNVCSVACKDWNQLNPGLVSWRKQKTHEMGENFFPLSMACNHCAEPACVKACPIGAIEKEAGSGIVNLDRSKCKSLQSCISACPYAVPQIADDKQEPNPIQGWVVRHPAQKCTMCADRLADGEKPMCVVSCVGRAMDFGTVDYINAEYPDAVRLNAVDFPYAYKPGGVDNTKPSLFIKGRNGLKIHKSPDYTGKVKI